jgi:acetyl esterase/lipase
MIELPQLKINPKRIVSSGNSSGGDMAIQFHVAFSKNVTGLCGADAQPWRCAATRF